MATCPCGLTVRESLARRLRIWRAHAGLPLKRMAADLGVSPSSLYAWETGARFPTAEKLDDLAKYLGLCPKRILCPAEPFPSGIGP